MSGNKMVETAPFPNLYCVKHVSETASKACALCFKPTNTVLITVNQKDWFYICKVHLQDKNYAQLVYCDDTGKDLNDEWSRMCALVGDLQKEVHLLEKKEKEMKQQEKSWLGGIGSMWASKKDEQPKKEENGKNDGNSGEKEEEYDVLGKKRVTVFNELEESRNQLAAFERSHTKYRLDVIFYKGRLMQDFKRKKQRAVEQKLSDGTLFPSLDGLPSLKR